MHEPIIALEANGEMVEYTTDLTMPEFMQYRIEFGDGMTDRIPLILPHGVHPRYSFDADIKYPIVIQMSVYLSMHFLTLLILHTTDYQ
jgi:hypothetical protein